MPYIGDQWISSYRLSQMAGQAGDTLPTLNPDEHRGLLRSLGSGTLNAAIGASNLVDLPMSMVRDAITWNNPIDQLRSPFSQANRMTGRDVYRHYGLAKEEDTWPNFIAGLGSEIISDPTTYLSLGGSALGKFARIGKEAGVLAEAAEIAGKQAGRRIGPREFSMIGSKKDLLKAAKDSDTHMFKGFANPAEQILDKEAYKYLQKRGVPFTGRRTGFTIPGGRPRPMQGAFEELISKEVTGEVPKGLGGGYMKWGLGGNAHYFKSPQAQWIARNVDRAAHGIRKSPPIKYGAKLLESASRNQYNWFGQVMGAKKKRFFERNIGGIRQMAASIKTLQDEVNLSPLQGKKLTDTDWINMIERADIGLDDVPKLVDFGAIDDPAMAARFKTAVTAMHEQLREMKELGIRHGSPLPELSDSSLNFAGYLINRYFGRIATIAPSEAKAITSGAMKGIDPFELHRAPYLTGMPEGSLPLHEMFDDGFDGLEAIKVVRELRDALDQTATKPGRPKAPRSADEAIDNSLVAKRLKGVTDHLARRFGKGTLRDADAYRASGFTGPMTGERILRNYWDKNGKMLPLEQGDRYVDMAMHMAKFTDAEIKLGMYANNPIKDFELRMISGWDKINTNQVAIEAVADLARVGARQKVEGLDPSNPAATRNIMMPPGDGGPFVRIGTVFEGENVRLSRGDVNQGAIRSVAEQLAKIKTETGNKFRDIFNKDLADFDDVDFRTLENLYVPQEFSDGLKRLIPKHQQFKDPQPWIRALDSYTNWFKTINTQIWPSFNTRNYYGGQTANAYEGIIPWNPIKFLKLQKNIHHLLSDANYAIPGSKEWPSLVEEWKRQGRNMADWDDNSATQVLRELAYAHDMAGPGAGIARGTSAAAYTSDVRDTLTQPHRQDVEFIGSEPITVQKFLDKLFNRKGGYNYNIGDVRGTNVPSKSRGGVRGFVDRQWPIHLGDTRISSGNAIVAASEDVGSFIEAMNRMSGFAYQMEKGVDPAYAAKKVMATQVDYSWRQYTDFEKEFLTRAIPFYKWCVSESHEILTRRGWQTVDSLELDDLALSLDHDTGQFEWAAIEEVAVFGCYEEEVYHWKHPAGRLDFTFTKDHRWPVTTPIANYVLSSGEAKVAGGLRKMVRACDIEGKNGYKVPCTGDYQQKCSILSPRLAAILGWIVTDGYHRWRGAYCEMLVYQHPKKFLVDVVTLLGNPPRKPHPDTGTVAVPVSLADSRKITKVFKSKQDLPRIVCCLSREAAEAMWDAMFMAEGTVRGKDKEQFFYQEDQNVNDAFQILCLLTGRSGNQAPNGCSVKKSKRYGYYPEHVTKEKFTGRVWCPTTKHGTWVMRNNGVAVITGNTRKMLPWTVKQLIEKPGGPMAQTIRTQRHLGSGEEFTPQRAREGMGFNIGDPDAQGMQKWMTQIDLPHEGATSMIALGGGLGGNLVRTGQKIVGSSHPWLRMGLERLTNRHFFTGKDLDQLEGGVAAILNNAGEIRRRMTGKDFEPFTEDSPGMTVANVVADSIGRGPATLRKLLDVRGQPEERGLSSLLGLPTSKSDILSSNAVQKLTNFFTGLRISNIDTKEALNRESSEVLKKLMDNKPYVRTLEQPYIPKRYLPYVDEETRFFGGLLKGIRKQDADERKELEKMGFSKSR